nr:Holliday junction branch migration protein RuvA [Methanolinea mesophila]
MNGEVVRTGEGYAIIRVGGIGFHVAMPAPELEEVSRRKEEVTVLTHLVVREDGLFLYGFLHQSTLEMFRMLIGVNRVGPALAMNILSRVSIPDFTAAVLGDDEKVLTRVPGIGQKNAKRLILELKDRMQKKAGVPAGAPVPAQQVRHDAVSALIALGFGEKESYAAVESALSGGRDLPVQTVIKAALSVLKER